MDKMNRKIVLFFISILLGISLIILDQTAIPFALPAIEKTLFLSPIMELWIANSYLLAAAIFMIIAGKFSDLFGSHLVFRYGLIGFIIASLLCALATSGTTLIISRFIQGIFSAFLLSSTSVLVIQNLPKHFQGKGLGIYMTCGSAFFALGPFWGGLFTTYLNWRAIFWINIPIGLLSLLIFNKTFIMPLQKQSSNQPINWPAFLSFGLGVFCLIFFLMECTANHYDKQTLIYFLIIAVLAFLLYAFIEYKSKQPLINFLAFHSRSFWCCMIVSFSVRVSFVTIIFTSILFQVGFHYSAIQASFLIMPIVIPSLIFAYVSGNLFDRFGPKAPLAAGLLLIILGLIETAVLVSYQNYWLIFPGLLLLGIGLALSIPATLMTALLTVDSAHRGMASGIANFIRQLATTSGLAMLTSIYQFSLLHTNEALKNPAIAVFFGYKMVLFLALFIAIVGAISLELFMENKKLA